MRPNPHSANERKSEHIKPDQKHFEINILQSKSNPKCQPNYIHNQTLPKPIISRKNIKQKNKQDFKE